MKKRLGMLTGFGILIFFLSLTPAIAAKRVVAVVMGRGEARVGVLIGNARVIPAEGNSARQLIRNDLLRGGDEVATGAGSRLELLLPDSSRVRFNENTRFRIQEINYGGQDSSRSVRIDMTLGKAWANVAKVAGGRSKFELRSENAVAGVRGTVYHVNVEKDQSSLIKVYDGQVYVSGGGKFKNTTPAVMGSPSKINGPRTVPGPRKVSMDEWTVIIRAMQQIRVNADGTPGKPSDFTMAEDKDEWVEWNRLRDRAEDS